MVLVGNCYDEQIRLLRCKYIVILFGRSKQIFGTHIIAPTLECRHCSKIPCVLHVRVPSCKLYNTYYTNYGVDRD